MDNLIVSDFNKYGYMACRSIFPQSRISHLLALCTSLKQNQDILSRSEKIFAIRNLLQHIPELNNLVNDSELTPLLTKLLGSTVYITRAIYFDKTSHVNWKVPWHQDTTIAVKKRVEQEGFTNWSIKAGVNHVQPPLDIMENILTVRIHLDESTLRNGALRVIPGTHTLGKLSAENIRRLTQENMIETCEMRAGDVLFIRPLLLHSSLPGSIPSHRRIIHLELSANKLAEPLEWYGT